MDDNKLRFGVGVLVIATIGIAIILTFLFGAFPTVLNREYTLYVEFPSAEGVSTNTPVLRDGVRVGRVADIDLIEEKGVLLTLSMDASVPLTHRYYPRIGNGSLITGDATVEFVLGDEQTLARKLDNNLDLISKPYTDKESVFYGEKTSNPMNVFVEMEDDVLRTLEQIQRAGEAVERVSGTVDKFTLTMQQTIGGGDSTMQDLTLGAKQTLEEFQGAIRDIRSIISNPIIRQNLESSIAKLPEILGEAKTTLEATQQTLQSFERAGDQFEKVGVVAERVGVAAEETVTGAKRSVAGVERVILGAERTMSGVERTVENVERFTKPLGDRGPQLVEQVLVSLANLDNALLQIDTFGQALNNSDGTVRRLLEDDDLYWQIRRTMDNVEQASARIRPILDDVRTFSDKVARDPRELGVRGALTKRPSGNGLK